jgi:FMN phosphatase YigB (HAD superfamily)
MRLDRPVEAVLLDVDGTLYHQGPLRFLMALELVTLPFTMGSFRSAVRVWEVLRVFRQVREELRHLSSPEESLADLQYLETARRIGIASADVGQIVGKWIYRKPLKYLALCRRRGVPEFLTFLEQSGRRIGIFSDYPIADKLKALRLSKNVGLLLCATDPNINAFKPHPKGFLHACAVWGLPPEKVLYVGDRPEVDAVGAAAAGLPCALFYKKARPRGRPDYSNYLPISSFAELQYAFINNGKC